MWFNAILKRYPNQILDCNDCISIFLLIILISNQIFHKKKKFYKILIPPSLTSSVFPFPQPLSLSPLKPVHALILFSHTHPRTHRNFALSKTYPDTEAILSLTVIMSTLSSHILCPLTRSLSLSPLTRSCAHILTPLPLLSYTLFLLTHPLSPLTITHLAHFSLALTHLYHTHTLTSHTFTHSPLTYSPVTH